MSPVVKLSRRRFLAVSGASAAGLWLGVRPDRAAAAERAPAPAAGLFRPSAWLQVDGKGQVTVWLARSEMGQGVMTSMPMLVAEELEVDLAAVRVVQADAEARFGQMGTGGSRSVRASWEPLRKAGAAAREMLVAAAAARWGVPGAECRAEKGAVLHPGSGRRLGYGDLAAAAAKLEVPKEPRLKGSSEFRLIGKRTARLDTPAKVRGQAAFGLDVRVPGMLFAAVARPPVLGGKVIRYEAAAARSVAGVRAVVEVPSGVAVVAASTWAAVRGREALQPVFDPGPNGALDQAAIARLLAAPEAPIGAVRTDGHLEAALAGATRRIAAVYELPLLAHATMEPMNCTARVKDGRVEIWAPTQAPSWAMSEVAKALEVAEDKVTLHVTFLGGGFGRRAFPDFVVEAAHVARAAGAPVQVFWTREDDMRHDFYRPPSRHELRGGLDGAGRIAAWHHRVRAPSIAAQHLGGGRPRPDVVEGAADLPYQAGAVTVDCAMPSLGVPLGWWRSVYSSQNAFADECFVDELAAAASQDPVGFRLANLPEGSRLGSVLRLAAEKAAWGSPLPAGRGRGVACYTSFGSHVAEVAEVSAEKGQLRIHRVVVGLDCGQVVNPDTVEAQMESAIAYGLSAALRGEITVEKGAVREGNFDQQEPLRISEMPAVEVHLVRSAEPPGGVGEPGLPPIAPAVANALFAATGQRVRRLPIRVAVPGGKAG